MQRGDGGEVGAQCMTDHRKMRIGEMNSHLLLQSY